MLIPLARRVKEDNHLEAIVATTTKKPRPVAEIPEGFELKIPAVFEGMFMFPTARLEKAPSGAANNWQNRTRGLPVGKSATGYGIPAGKNNLIFIDLDQHSPEKDGLLHFQKLVDEFGGGVYPDTYEFQTGSGAKQLVFSCTPEITESIKPSQGDSATGLTLGVDVRAKTSYSVGPGSIVDLVVDKKYTGTVGYYKELTPGKQITPIQEVPWLLEMMQSRSAKKTRNETYLAWKAAQESLPAAKTSEVAAMEPPAVASDYPKLSSQKGEKAILPVIGSLIDAVEGGAQRHPSLFTAGLRAGQRGCDETAFIADAMDRLRPLALASESNWFEYDLEHAEKQLRSGWAVGNDELEKKADLESAYRFDHLADRFREEHPEYRWVVPRGTTDGSWYRFETDPHSKSYGIYAPITDEVFANAANAWLRADEEAAAAAGDTARAKEAAQAIQGAAIYRMIAHLRGEIAIHAELESYDAAPFEIVDNAGIRDLRTMAVRGATPDFLATRKLPFTGSRKAYENQKENIEKLMSSVSSGQRPLLDAFLGTLLLQRQPISKKGLILWGPSKDNGKSTLVEAIFGVLGSSGQAAFGYKAPHPMIYKDNGNSYAEADLDNRTTTVFDDYPRVHEPDGDKLKLFIGSGRTHQARQIHKATREIRLVHTVLITCNELPRLGRGEDVIERFEVVLFPYKYPAENEFDPKNKWHRKRDGAFIDTVRDDPEFREGFYYYLLLKSKEWAESMGEIETSTIDEETQEYKADLRQAGNNLISLLTEYAAPSRDHFVSEKDLVGMLREKLKEQGMGVLSEQSVKKELAAIALFREWRVEHYAKKSRSTSKKLKGLTQSKWRPDYTLSAAVAPDSANIFAGIRLKTDAAGNFLDEDAWIKIAGRPPKVKGAPRSAAEAEDLADRFDAEDSLDDLADLADDADLDEVFSDFDA